MGSFSALSFNNEFIYYIHVGIREFNNLSVESKYTYGYTQKQSKCIFVFRKFVHVLPIYMNIDSYKTG